MMKIPCYDAEVYELYDRLAYMAADIEAAANVLEDMRQDVTQSDIEEKMRMLIYALAHIVENIKSESRHHLQETKKAQDVTT